MRIYTKKQRGLKLRVRDVSLTPGYVAEYATTHYVPSIQVTAKGEGGTTYYVSLNSADCEAIAKAREQYNDYFTRGEYHAKV